MADQPDVLKRLEEIQLFWNEEVYCSDSDIVWLLKLTRALLEIQGELMERVGDQECHCCERLQRNVWVSECPRCKVLARAEKVRKGEV